VIDSPFGSVKPENLPPVKETMGRNIARIGTGPRKKRPQTREHYARVIALMEREFGGFFWTCDGKKVVGGGALVATDLLGFMDLQGIAHGRFIAANVTSKPKIGAHMRDYTNPAKTHGPGKVPVRDLLRRFLQNGGTLFIYGYEKVGARWQYERVEVTESLMAEYEGRKRGVK
jgi:hypothetical protein